MSEAKQPQRIHFSYHPSNGTPEGDTYRYLLRNELFDCKRGKMLADQAIAAWWLPYAWQANEVRARKMAIDCIEQLEQHIAKLRRDFQIPPTAVAAPAYHTLPTDQTEKVDRSPANTSREATIEAVVTDESLYATFDVFEE